MVTKVDAKRQNADLAQVNRAYKLYRQAKVAGGEKAMLSMG